MAQRNLLCTRQMYDLEIEQDRSNLQPEPCILLGNTVDFPNPNIHPAVPASGSTTNLDPCHLPAEHHGSTVFYGNQYNGLQHHPVTNLDLGLSGSPNFSYNPYMMSSSASRFGPMPLNHGSSDHNIPSSSNHGALGVSLDEYGRNTHFMDNIRGSCKRKTAEGVPGSYHVDGSSSSSSSSGVPFSSGPQHWEEPFEIGIGMFDPAAHPASECRGNGVLSISEGPQRSVRSRSNSINLMDPSLAHHNHLVQGNYMGGSFQPAGNSWMEQFTSNTSDGSNSSWNYASSMPQLQGPLEVGSMSGQGYQEAVSNRNAGILLHPSSIHYLHHPPPLLQNMRGGHSYSYHPQVPTPSFRHPTNNNLHHGSQNTSRDFLESGSRYLRPFSSSGDRIYRPHRRVPQAAPEVIHGRIRYLSSEDVAMLEFSGFYGAANLIDQHRDMRLDIDDMSYEELLALEERIGDVNTGLSEESILKCLKTRTHVSCIASPPDQPASMMQDNETCIICQVEYEDKETIGILECGHEYHVDCIKQWLLLKNICPICKMSALSSDGKGG